MNTRLLASIVAVICTFFSVGSYAENAHSYNGSYCTNYIATDSNKVAHQYNGLRNTSAGSLYVTCPVAVDEVAVTTGTSRVWVHYSGTGTLSCNLYSMNGIGSINQSKFASVTNTNWMNIPNLTSEDFWGSSVIYCNLPANGVINTVWFGENN